MFDVGDGVVNLGIGIGSTLYSGSYYTSGVPPISLSYEQGIKDEVLDKGVIGVCGYVGYSSYKYRYTYFGSDWGWNYTNIFIGGGGLFHYPLVDNLDTYIGLLLGYQILTTKEYGTIPGEDFSSASGGLVFSSFVGGRYYFGEKFAVFAQLGYGISYLTFGLSIKL